MLGLELWLDDHTILRVLVRCPYRNRRKERLRIAVLYTQPHKHYISHADCVCLSD